MKVREWRFSKNLSFSFWVGVGVTGVVVTLVDEEDAGGVVGGRGEGGVAGWADEVTTGVPLELVCHQGRHDTAPW